MVLLAKLDIAIIADTADEVLEVAESVIHRRASSHEDVVVHDCVSVDAAAYGRLDQALADSNRCSDSGNPLQKNATLEPLGQAEA
jgi:hypothetical protein